MIDSLRLAVGHWTPSVLFEKFLLAAFVLRQYWPVPSISAGDVASIAFADHFVGSAVVLLPLTGRVTPGSAQSDCFKVVYSSCTMPQEIMFQAMQCSVRHRIRVDSCNSNHTSTPCRWI